MQNNACLVCMKDVERLKKEVTILKLNLPKVLNKDVVKLLQNVSAVEQENQSLKQQLDLMHSEKEHWKNRCEAALSEIDKEKEEKFALQCNVQDLTSQLNQQSEYCSSMGAACSTLLWRVSRCEESISAILGGTKVEEFLTLVASTIESFVSTYSEEFPAEKSEEMQFILALCGIITNIAASPIGRDFIMKNENGIHLVDVFISTLSRTPAGKCMKLKNLILMALFNISINQRGIQHISSHNGIMGLLAWQLHDVSENENRLHSIRLIQSLLYEENKLQLVTEAKEVLTDRLLQELASDHCKALREATLELVSDLKSIQ